MSLLASPRLTAADLEAWSRLSRYDQALSNDPRINKAAEKAVQVMERFVSEKPAVIGFSGGKDSTVVVGLAAEAGLKIPVWRMILDKPGRAENPDVALVRDALLERYPDLDYSEFTTGAKDGLAAMNRRTGGRYISGVRGDESSNRKIAMSVYGLATENTCRPIGYWKILDVWAYLAAQDLPICPSYGCTFGGSFDRNRIRVHVLGGPCSDSMRAWEEHYYAEEMRPLTSWRNDVSN